MSDQTSYDPENIFAKILKGEIPCHKVFENKYALAFMDIMPRADGHTLVIPKSSARNILDIEPRDLSELILATQHVAKGVKAAMSADGITLQQFSEEAGGQVVFHLHFHIMPRWTGIKLRPHTGDMADNETLAENAAKISKFL